VTVSANASSGGIGAGVPEEFARQLRGAARGLLDRVEVGSVRVVRLQPHLREVAQHRGQQVVEVVGDAAGHLAERLHLLRLL